MVGPPLGIRDGQTDGLSSPGLVTTYGKSGPPGSSSVNGRQFRELNGSAQRRANFFLRVEPLLELFERRDVGEDRKPG